MTKAGGPELPAEPPAESLEIGWRQKLDDPYAVNYHWEPYIGLGTGVLRQTMSYTQDAYQVVAPSYWGMNVQANQ